MLYIRAGDDVRPLATCTISRSSGAVSLPAMCGACAMAAMAGASGVRSWLQAHHLGWLTPQRLRVLTIAGFVVAMLGSSVTLSGSTAPANASAARTARVAR